MPEQRFQCPPEQWLLAGNKQSLIWAVGCPDGPRSETWVVKAHFNQRGQTSVYMGTRRQMGAVKLSIHEGCWQFAFTAESILRLPPGTDRQLTKFTPPNEIAQGWRRAAVILIPTTTLGRSLTDNVDPTEDIQWWPAPPQHQHLQFHPPFGLPDPQDQPVRRDDPLAFLLCRKRVCATRRSTRSDRSTTP